VVEVLDGLAGPGREDRVVVAGGLSGAVQARKGRPTYAPRTSHKDQGRIAMKLYGLIRRVRPKGLEPPTF